VSIVVVATIYPQPEHRDAVIAAFRDAVPAVHREPGCALYALHEGPDRLVMIEQWESRQALEIHSKGDALRALNPRLKDKLAAETEVLVFDPLPVGDDERGRLRP
jgi:quinol monooxygenase YgiN